jgi:hypothetical protein
VTDTTLFTEKLVDLTTSAGTDHTVGASTRQTTTVTNDTYQVIGTRTATGAGTVTNAGLFDAASGGNLFLKGDFTGIGLRSATRSSSRSRRSSPTSSTSSTPPASASGRFTGSGCSTAPRPRCIAT